MNLDSSTLRRLLTYSPDTGALVWNRRPSSMFSSRSYADRWNNRYAGRETGVEDGGYLKVRLGGKTHKAHRLAWQIYFGVEPPVLIDHINGDGTDNRIANLRSASCTENSRNKHVVASKSSGRKGVCWHKRLCKWQAQIRVDGRAVYLGVFESLEKASNAYDSAAAKYFGSFAKSNKEIDFLSRCEA